MRFEVPEALWLLAVVPPALILLFWWSARRRRELMGRFIEARLLPGLVAGVSPLRRRLRQSLLVGAACFLILALARPQWGFVWEEVKQRGLDIVVALDVSKSMLAQDITPNRLARAKLAALDLMKLARTDRLGLVGFAGSAFLQCPLTIDDAAFGQSLEALDVSAISDGGTALAGAIAVARTAYKEGEAHKVLVILTDGEDHEAGAVEAAREAAADGVQIFTIGIGTAEGELLRIVNAKGEQDYVRDEAGNVVKSRLNEDLLREIAGATERGFYLPLRGKAIDTLFNEGLAPLPKSDATEKLVRRYHERFHWPLGLAVLFLAMEKLLPERPRPSRQPEKLRKPAKAASAVAATALVAALLAAPLSALASPSQALRDYRRGNYQASLQEYLELLGKNPDDPRLQFNAGAAAYQNRQFDEAIKRFDRALASPSLELQQDAYYNRGNSRYWMGEAAPDPAQTQEAWQKALQDFESSLKLDPADADARANYEFVKKQLEELKQQQQQNQQNQNQQQDQRPEDDQQQKQQQNQQPQQNQSQDQGQNQQRGEGQQQPDPQPQPGQPPQEQDQQPKQAQQAQPQKEQPPAGQPQPESQRPEGSPGADEESGAASADQSPMSPEQARQLLDAQRGEEKVLPVSQGEKRPGERSRKEW